MARIRTIKPEFWVDDAMVELSPWARLLFIALLNFVDDEGLIEYKPKRIKMQVFPADSVSVQGELDALIESSRLEVVSSDQGNLLHVVNFRRHQAINRPTPTRFTGLPADFSLSTPLLVSESSSWKGKEGKGKEGNVGRSIPIPSDWQPTDEHAAKARELRVDLKREAEAFRLHAQSVDRRVVRWNAAFSMWLTKAKPGPKPAVDWMNR